MEQLHQSTLNAHGAVLDTHLIANTESLGVVATRVQAIKSGADQTLSALVGAMAAHCSEDVGGEYFGTRKSEETVSLG